MGAATTVPLITALVQAPKDQYRPGGVDVDLVLADKLSVLDGDTFGKSKGFDKGVNIVATVKSVIASTGLPARDVVIGESAKTLRNSMAWDPGTTKLRIVNDLLEAAGYWPVWCDGFGRFRSSDYTEPAERPVVWDFADDPDKGLFLPDWTNERNTARPNRYVCISRADGDKPPLVSIKSSQAGFDEIGFWRATTDVDVEAADQDALDKICARRLSAARSKGESITFTHAWVPELTLNSVITFSHSRLGRTMRGGVSRMDWTLRAGGLIETTAQKVS